jgi:hypothetical protein
MSDPPVTVTRASLSGLREASLVVTTPANEAVPFVSRRASRGCCESASATVITIARTINLTIAMSANRP